MRRIRKSTQPSVDPITGDLLRPIERFSLFVQGRMRQWRFILLYSALTFTWWAMPTWFGDTASYTKWQLGASYMALLIESVVGIGMFGWARRDSVVLRKVHALEEAANATAARDAEVLRKLEQTDEINAVLLNRVVTLLEAHAKNGNGNGNGTEPTTTTG